MENLLYGTHCSTYYTAYTDACKACHTITVYIRLPEDESSGSKHVEDIKI